MVLLVLVLSPPAAIAALGCIEQAVEPNFSLEYMEGPVAADRGEHLFLRIKKAAIEPGEDSAASDYVLLQGRENSFISKETGDYTTVTDLLSRRRLKPSELEGLMGALNKHCFWTLAAKYQDSSILDGWYERIRVVNGETEHQVVCVNKRKDRFQGVKDYLFETLYLDE